MNIEQIITILHLTAMLLGTIIMVLWPLISRGIALIALHSISLLIEATATLLSLLIIHGIIPN